MSAINDFDIFLFHGINEGMAYPVLDVVMPLVSGNAAFFPLLIAVTLVIVRQGGWRGLALVMMRR